MATPTKEERAQAVAWGEQLWEQGQRTGTAFMARGYAQGLADAREKNDKEANAQARAYVEECNRLNNRIGALEELCEQLEQGRVL